MTQGFGDLNGSGPQQIFLDVYRTGQNVDGNYSSYHASGKYLAKNYGSWSGSTMSWSLNCNGQTWSGTFTIPSPGRDDIQLFDIDFNIGADGNGYGPGFNSTASMSTNHSSIGSGSVTVGESAPPRIPRVPYATGVPGASSVTSSSMHLSWGGTGDDGGAGIDSYQVQVSLNSDMSGQVAAPVVGGGDADIGGLSRVTRYYFRSRAHNSRGWGDWSGVGYADTIADVPSAPGVPSASSIASSSMHLAWGGSGDNGGAGIDSYQVQVSTNPDMSGQVALPTVGGTAADIGGLARVTRYYFRARAHNGRGYSGWSGVGYADTLAVPPSAPGAPVASLVTPTTMRLDWAASGDNGGAAIDQHLLRRSTNPDVEAGPYVDTPLSGTALNTVISGLQPATTYYWCVYARNGRGYSPRSGITQTRTKSGGKIPFGGVWKDGDLKTPIAGGWKDVELFTPVGGVWKNVE